MATRAAHLDALAHDGHDCAERRETLLREAAVRVLAITTVAHLDARSDAIRNETRNHYQPMED